jgi:hypothetical protein
MKQYATRVKCVYTYYRHIKIPQTQHFGMSILHYYEMSNELTIINPHVDNMIAVVEKMTRKCRKAL